MVIQAGRRAAAAPLDPAELALVLKPFGESRMLPRAAYVDEALFAWEQENFFGGGWMCVGRSDSMPNAGDQRAESVGHSGVLLIRDAAGELRAFANACRHRNHEILPCGETANRPIVLCPYHGWSYRLDGSLRKAAGYDDADWGCFEADDNGLVQLPAEEWHGWVFVDGSGQAGPFADHIVGLEQVVAAYEPERLQVAGTHEYVVPANWKILGENYQECYHCPVIHPELCAVSPPQSGDNYVHPAGGAWVGGWMDIREGADTMSLDGRTKATYLRGLDERRRHIVDYIGVFPNLLISLHPDYVMTHVLTPLAAGSTKIVCTWAFSPEDVAREDFDPSFGIDFWDITNRQDWAACSSVQRGLSSPHAVPGLMSQAEDGVYQLVTMIARGYMGLPLRAGNASVAGARAVIATGQP